jgi:hypothetical protein
MGGMPSHTTTNKMDNKQQIVSRNGAGQKCSARQLNGTYIQEGNEKHSHRLHSSSNDFVRIKIGAILMGLWHFEGKRAHFV